MMGAIFGKRPVAVLEDVTGAVSTIDDYEVCSEPCAERVFAGVDRFGVRMFFYRTKADPNKWRYGWMESDVAALLDPANDIPASRSLN